MNARTCLFAGAILLAFLPGCGGGSAVDVAGKFWKAVNDGDIEKARSYATSGSAETLTMNDNGGDAEVDVEFGAATVEGERTTIETHMMTRMDNFSQTVEMKTVLVMEDGE